MKKLFTELDEKKEKLSKVYSWEAQERYWVEKDRAWYVTYSFFFVVLVALGVMIGEYVLVVAILAFVFLWFTQASVPPLTVKHTITQLGIKTFDKLHKWKIIKHFWFSEKHGIKYLHLDLKKDKDNEEDLKTIILLVQNNEDENIFFNLIENVDYGDKDEIGFNFINQVIDGNYVPISHYLPEDSLSQEEYLGQKTDAPVF